MKPTLEEVKAYFKNAKEVRSFGIYRKDSHKIKIDTLIYDKSTNSYYCDTDNLNSDVMLWRNQYGYAKIISYKEPQFEYLEEVEVSDDGESWIIRQYLCEAPNGKYIVWNGTSENRWNYIRKLNTERTQAIETIKELMTKHEIKTTEL